jgi:hypothetical protein
VSSSEADERQFFQNYIEKLVDHQNHLSAEQVRVWEDINRRFFRDYFDAIHNHRSFLSPELLHALRSGGPEALQQAAVREVVKHITFNEVFELNLLCMGGTNNLFMEKPYADQVLDLFSELGITFFFGPKLFVHDVVAREMVKLCIEIVNMPGYDDDAEWLDELYRPVREVPEVEQEEDPPDSDD